MSRRARALRALGLNILIMLCLMLVAASAADAGTYEVLGKPIAETAEATVEPDSLGVLKVSAINLELDCTKIDTGEGKLLVTGSSDVVLSLLECKVYQLSPLTLLSECEVYPTTADRTAGTNKGTITVKALLKVIAHEGKQYLLAEPLGGAGTLFTKIFYKNCPGSASADVKGSLVLELTETTAVKQLVQPASAALFASDKLMYGESAATLEGSVWAKLTGALAGEPWGIEPYPTENIYEVLGKPIAETAEATVEPDSLGVLKVSAINLELDCTKIDTGEGKLLVTGSSDVVLSLLECKVYQLSPLTLLSECEVYPTTADRTAGTNKGTITVKALLKVIAHEGKQYLLAEPLGGAGTLFTKIFYKNCPGSASADVKGSLVLELTETTAVKQLVQPASAALFASDKLMYGESAATLEGSVWAKLTGALAGEPWGIEPYPTENIYEVLGKPIAETAEATVEPDSLGVLKVSAINLELDCTKIDTGEGKLLVTGSSDVVLSLLECKVYQLSPLTLLSECEVYPTTADRTAGTNKGTITVKALLKVIAHEGKQYLLAEPLGGAGTLFTKIFYKNCPGSASADVKGSLVLELTETTAVKQLVQPASAALFASDKLMYGESAATLEGSVWAKLTGALAGEPWGIG